MDKKQICPCCGFKELSFQPYEKIITMPVDPKLSIPYSNHFGEPSFEVCDCCGYEFGNDDEPGTAAGSTFQEYLKEWINDGCNWVDKKRKPIEWDIDEQLDCAYITKR